MCVCVFVCVSVSLSSCTSSMDSLDSSIQVTNFLDRSSGLHSVSSLN